MSGFKDLVYPVFIFITFTIIQSFLMVGVVKHYDFGSSAGVVMYSLAMVVALAGFVFAFRR